MTKEYRTIQGIAGPLVFVEKTHPVAYGEIVSVQLPNGDKKRGQVLDTAADLVAIQIVEGTEGIDRNSSVRFMGETLKFPVSAGQKDEPSLDTKTVMRRECSFPGRILTASDSTRF